MEGNQLRLALWATTVGRQAGLDADPPILVAEAASSILLDPCAHAVGNPKWPLLLRD